jgi:hypothetical protein
LKRLEKSGPILGINGVFMENTASEKLAVYLT